MESAAVAGGGSHDSDGGGRIQERIGKPIADLFPDATVLFADLVGFTKWSSSRSPTDVFVLLETLYDGFDVIANRMGVFKVETVGKRIEMADEMIVDPVPHSSFFFFSSTPFQAIATWPPLDFPRPETITP